MKHIVSKALLAGAATLIGLSSCNGLLDREPLDQVSPGQFYTSPEQLSSFTINQYPNAFSGPSGYGEGVAGWDDGTDNQADVEPNRTRFLTGEWKVPATGSLNFENIRNVNWFLTDVTAKREAGRISGTKEQIDTYIGEAYVLRAVFYFSKLMSYGDYPIVTEPLMDKEEDLIKAAKRMPRNEVARFILSDLDKAIELLPETHAAKQRISKPVARLIKSRVALFEGTFEKYHRGTGRVPGDANWPGKDKEWNQGKSFDIDAEVRFFLGEAIKEAKLVADNITLTPNSGVMVPTDSYSGWNLYYDMFATANPSAMSEVLLWRQYSMDRGIVHNTTNRLYTGGNTGWTRSLVESFLMQNGLPIYAASSGYAGDATLEKVKTGRDQRLQLFLYDEKTPLRIKEATPNLFTSPSIFRIAEARDVTGYRQRKGYNYDPSFNVEGVSDRSAYIVFRGAEAMLNYIEAYYELHTSLDATAKNYWTALRQRAGITADIQVTIDATDMAREADVTRPSYDWGAFSAGKAIDKTLYSIRRERRCEFAGEGRRLFDLLRWRAMDQVKDYQIEGFNLWEEMYKYRYFIGKDFVATTMYPEGAQPGETPAVVLADGSAKALVSSRELGNYLRPYQKQKANNNMYNGYTFSQAHYLDPFSVLEMQLASPTKQASTSHLYQNIGWGTEANTPAQM